MASLNVTEVYHNVIKVSFMESNKHLPFKSKSFRERKGEEIRKGEFKFKTNWKEPVSHVYNADRLLYHLCYIIPEWLTEKNSKTSSWKI